MSLSIFDLLFIPWAIFCLYWLVEARKTRQTAKAETGQSRALHLGLLAVAFGLVFVPELGIGVLGQRFLPFTSTVFAFGLALAFIGIGFAIWARHELGANWSGTVTIKADHHLIETGPYALSRHPIYTGVLFALLGSAIAIGEWRGLLAIPVLLLAYWRKLRIEEQYLTQEFPAQYPPYRHHVKALVPFLF